jgi:hypothetical protein
MTPIGGHAATCIIELINLEISSANTVIFRLFLDDLPNEFWIVLSGEVGIFPPRLDDIIHRETKIFEKIKHALGFTTSFVIENIDAESLYVSVDFSKLDVEDREFLSHIRRIENDVIKFKHSYLVKKLGDLPDKVAEAKELFNHVRQQ